MKENNFRARDTVNIVSLLLLNDQCVFETSFIYYLFI